MSLAVLFPGQGGQTPGFLHRLPDIPAVRQTLGRSSERLGFDVRTLDSDTALAGTVSTQLGLLVAGAAFWNFLASEGVSPRAVAGMSVGAFAAAVACDAVALEDALDLVRHRAELMQAAFPDGADGMAAVQGLGRAQVESMLEGTELAIANFNSAAQFVVAGPRPSLDDLVHRALEAGASKATILATAVPSHVPRLDDASRELLALVQERPIQAPNKVMFSNRDARPITTAEGVRRELALNMATPVRWHDTMSAMIGLDISLVLEAPPGHALAGLAAETIPGIRAFSADEVRWDVLLRAACSLPQS